MWKGASPKPGNDQQRSSPQLQKVRASGQREEFNAGCFLVKVTCVFSFTGLPFALSHSRHFRKKSLHIDRARVDVIATCPCMQMAVLRGYMISKIVRQRVSLRRSKNRVDLIYFYFDVSSLHVDEKPQWLLSISDGRQIFRLAGPGVLS